jgi:quercetin dioxygenase-like cupin family protein
MNLRKVFGWLIGISLFFGVMIGWVAPLAFPPIAQVAQPIVCAGGELSQDVIREESASEVTYNSAFQCYREGEAATDVTASAILTAIGIYSLIAFLLLFFLGLRALRGQTARMREAIRAIGDPRIRMAGRTIDMQDADLPTKLVTLIDPDTHILDIHRGLSVAVRRRKPGPPERIDGMSVGIVTVEGEGPHNGEMHPDGDEILYVISGELTVHADCLDAPLAVPAGKAVVMPRGEWHKLTAPEGARCRIVHITPGPGGEARFD